MASGCTRTFALGASLPSSPATSTDTLRPFQLARFRAFTTLVASFSSTSKKENFCIRSIRPSSTRPRVLLFSRLINSLGKKLSILPRLMNKRVKPGSALRLLLRSLRSPSRHFLHHAHYRLLSLSRHGRDSNPGNG